MTRRLEADLCVRFPSVEVRIEEGDEGLMLVVRDQGVLWGEINTWMDEDTEVTDVDIEKGVLAFADDVFDNFWPDDVIEAWPLCSAHGDHPLQPRLVNQKASWTCTKGPFDAVPIGSLGRS